MDSKEKAKVLEALPSLRFSVELESGRVMIAYLAGRLHKNFIRVIVGDSVEVLVPSTGNIGRIIKRF